MWGRGRDEGAVSPLIHFLLSCGLRRSSAWSPPESEQLEALA